MGIDESMVAAGNAEYEQEKSRKQIDEAKAAIAKLPPATVERIRSRLYDAASGTGKPGAGDRRASALLGLLPSKEAGERTPEAKQLGRTSPEPVELEKPGALDRMGPVGDSIRRLGQTAQPGGDPGESYRSYTARNDTRSQEQRRQDTREANNPQANDPLAQLIIGGAMTAPIAPLISGAAEAIPLVGELAQGGRIGRTLFQGGTGAATGAASAKLAGGDPKMGAFLGGGLGALGGYAEAATQPGTQGGQILDDLAAVGAKPSLTRAARGGRFDEPFYKGLSEGEAGDLELAMATKNKLDTEFEATRQAEKQSIDSAEKNFIERHGQAEIDTLPLWQRAQAVKQANMSDDRPIMEGLNPEVERYAGLVSRPNDTFDYTPPGQKAEPLAPHSNRLGSQEGIVKHGTPEYIPPRPDVYLRQQRQQGRLDPPRIPLKKLDRLIAIKKAMREETEPGQLGTLQNLPKRKLYSLAGQGDETNAPLPGQSINELLKGRDPEYDAASKQYGDTMRELEHSNDVLRGSDEAGIVDPRVSSDERMLRNLRKAGDNPEKLAELRKLRENRPDSLLDLMIAHNQAKKLELGVKPSISVPWTVVRTLNQGRLAAELRLADPLGRLAQKNMPALPLEYQLYERGKTESERKKKKQKEEAR